MKDRFLITELFQIVFHLIYYTKYKCKYASSKPRSRQGGVDCCLPVSGIFQRRVNLDILEVNEWTRTQCENYMIVSMSFNQE